MTRLIASLLVIALLTGCSEGKRKEAGTEKPAFSSSVPVLAPTGSDDDQARQIVRHYNLLLSEGYRTLNMTRLTEVASQDQAEKAYIHMAALGEGQARMLSTVKNIEFTSLKREKPDTIVARTKELWDFAYTDIKTGKETGKVNDFVYEVTYTLKKKGQRWSILDVVAYAPNDREESQLPRVVRPPERKETASAILPPGHRKVGP